MFVLGLFDKQRTDGNPQGERSVVIGNLRSRRHRSHRKKMAATMCSGTNEKTAKIAKRKNASRNDLQNGFDSNENQLRFIRRMLIALTLTPIMAFSTWSSLVGRETSEREKQFEVRTHVPLS